MKLLKTRISRWISFWIWLENRHSWQRHLDCHYTRDVTNSRKVLITVCFWCLNTKHESGIKISILLRIRNVMNPESKVETLHSNAEFETFRLCKRFISKFQFELALYPTGWLIRMCYTIIVILSLRINLAHMFCTRCNLLSWYSGGHIKDCCSNRFYLK